ncbi:hypothetical protein [Psychrobacter pygoscelis]|uniref:hypothetical protein n=1 Tax=Psychrobacter pygoscelis TaxID=2488563 RepID=UPI0013F4258F|nr:hypothetical protein [Psychrobacter pygoscelis]
MVANLAIRLYLLGWAGCGHLAEGSLAEQECHQLLGPPCLAEQDTAAIEAKKRYVS